MRLYTCSVHTYVVCIAVRCMHLDMVFDKVALNVYIEPCMYMYKLWSVVSLSYISFIAGRTKCLSLVCHGRPSCRCWVPCPQDGGPPLWLWWWWSHSLASCSLLWAVVNSGLPHEILWIRCESHWQGWTTLFAACLMCILCSLWTHLLHGHSRHGHSACTCSQWWLCAFNLQVWWNLDKRHWDLVGFPV